MTKTKRQRKVVDDSAKLFAKVLDERDEYRKAAKENLELCEKRRKERDELQAKLEETEFARDQAMDLVDDLGAERDEWKAKADKLTERMDKREDTMRRLAKLVDVTPEAEYAYNGDPQSVVDGGDFGELATLVFGAMRRLKAEGSSKVRAGSSNLEWLYEHDMELAGYEHQHDERLKAFEIAYRTQLDRLTEQNNQQARIIENLAAALARSTE